MEEVRLSPDEHCQVDEDLLQQEEHVTPHTPAPVASTHTAGAGGGAGWAPAASTHTARGGLSGWAPAASTHTAGVGRWRAGWVGATSSF